MLMNVTVFAGTAEFLMVEMWAMPVLQVVIAVFIINFRYLLIGASLKPLFNDTPLWKKALLIHLVADENWAVTMAEYQKGKGSVWFLFGGGVILIRPLEHRHYGGYGTGLLYNRLRAVCHGFCGHSSIHRSGYLPVQREEGHNSLPNCRSDRIPGPTLY